MELSGIWKNYDGTNDILRGVDLVVGDAEIVSISGRNGCGKTTLLNISGCLDVASKGDLIIEGQNVNGLKEKELSRIRLRTIGYVFQDQNLIEELTVKQNVMLPLRLAKDKKGEKRTEELLGIFGIPELASRHPFELSTGQRQLVTVARALANDPSILLADEPIASLDGENRSLVLDALHKANEMGAAMIMTCHDHDTKHSLTNARKFTMIEGILKKA